MIDLDIRLCSAIVHVISVCINLLIDSISQWTSVEIEVFIFNCSQYFLFCAS